MQQFMAGGFVKRDTLTFETFPGEVTLKGEIACLGKIVIQVEKTLKVCEPGGDPTVKTVDYAYNAFIRNHNTFLRYDNAHAHPGHPDPHHKHIYDWKTGNKAPGTPQWIGQQGWPTLGAVIEEVELWYWENRTDLPDPDGVAELGLWGPTQTK